MLPRSLHLQRQGARSAQVSEGCLSRLGPFAGAPSAREPSTQSPLTHLLLSGSVEERRAREVDELLGPKKSPKPVADFIFGRSPLE